MKKPIKFTEKAITEIKRVAAAKEVALNEDYIRVSADDAGCCGFKYSLISTDEKAPDDFEVEIEGIRILIDKESQPRLNGAEVDYDIIGGDLLTMGFIFKNPNARACGCARSHSPDGEKS